MSETYLTVKISKSLITLFPLFQNEPMKFFFRITDINLVSERFDYFEPSRANLEDQAEAKIRQTRHTPTRTRSTTKKDFVKQEISVKIEESTSDSVTNGDKSSVKIECKEQNKKCDVKIKKEVIEENSEINKCSKLNGDKNLESDIPKPSENKISSVTTPENSVPTFKNCLANLGKPEIKTEFKTPNPNCTQELTIKTNQFTNVLGCDPKTNSELTSLQQKCFVPTLLKAALTPKSPKKQHSPKKTEKSTKSVLKPVETPKREDLPQTVEHIPKSFENIFKPVSVKSESKKNEKSKSESFSKTLKSIHETIKNFPRSDTPPILLENRISLVDSSTGHSTSNNIRAPSPKKAENTTNGSLKSPRGHSHHSPKSPKSPKVLRKLNEQLKMTENLLTMVRKASKASDARLEAKHEAASSHSHSPKKEIKSEPPLPVTPIKTEPIDDEDPEKTKFLQSIQLTAKSSLSPSKSPIKTTSPECLSPSKITPKTTATKVKIETADSTTKPETVKRKPPRKDKPVKRIYNFSHTKGTLKKPKLVPKILPKTTASTTINHTFTNVSPQLMNITKMISSTDHNNPQSSQLKSLFNSCNINIPSSLSITLTESPRSEDGTVYESKPNPIKPVQNYIEILKLPDNLSPTPSKNEEKSDESSDFNKDIKQEMKDESKLKQDILNKKLTFQTMFEEAIKKNETMKNQLIQIQNHSKTGESPKAISTPIVPSSLKPKKNQALDLSKTSPKIETPHKRNILEIAHQLSKKSRMEAENLIAKSPTIKSPTKSPIKEENKQINIINSSFTSGGSLSIQKKPIPHNKLPIPRLPVQKAPTLKLGPSNARAVPKPAPKVPQKPVKPPKPTLIENTPVNMNTNLTPNQILEKYNITSLQQLSSNLNQAQLAFQQALMMSHQLELQRLQANQKLWLGNPNVLAHYENYVQSLKNQQNQICGNTNNN